jgi:hypothetical protein
MTRRQSRPQPDSCARELLDLDADTTVTTPGEQPPPGYSSAAAGEPRELIVTVISSGPSAAVVDVARAWLVSQYERSPALRIDGDVFEPTKLSSGERSRLADQWLARHTDS